MDDLTNESMAWAIVNGCAAEAVDAMWHSRWAEIGRDPGEIIDLARAVNDALPEGAAYRHFEDDIEYSYDDAHAVGEACEAVIGCAKNWCRERAGRCRGRFDYEEFDSEEFSHHGP